MTPAQAHVLAVLAQAPVPEPVATVLRLRHDVLRRLCDAGLARWCPYARPAASWQITPAGRRAVAK